jgi:hypothetical protein
MFGIECPECFHEFTLFMNLRSGNATRGKLWTYAPKLPGARPEPVYWDRVGEYMSMSISRGSHDIEVYSDDEAGHEALKRAFPPKEGDDGIGGVKLLKRQQKQPRGDGPEEAKGEEHGAQDGDGTTKRAWHPWIGLTVDPRMKKVSPFGAELLVPSGSSASAGPVGSKADARGKGYSGASSTSAASDSKEQSSGGNNPAAKSRPIGTGKGKGKEFE